MRINRILYPLGLLSAVALTGCSQEEPLTRVTGTDDVADMWLALSVTGPETAARTRATNTDYETTIGDIVVYITEKGKKDILSVGFPIKYPSTGTEDISEVDLVHNGSGVYEALMPLTNKLTPGTYYDLHVAANLPSRDDILASVWTSGTDEVSGLTVDHSAITEWSCSAMRSGSTYIPMSSATPVSFKIEDKDYPRTSPISTDGTTTAKLSVTMTRLFARMDYKDASPTSTGANTYTVDNNNQVTVIFTSIKPMNLAGSSLLAFNKDTSTGQVNNPSGKSLSNNASAITLSSRPADDSGFVPHAYLSENTPVNTDAVYQNLTYLELTAKLSPVDATCPTELKNVLNGKDKDGNATTSHPALWYYDDGTFQSTLLLTAPEDETNWHKVEYATDGYYLTYRRAIRHDAGKDASGNDLNKDDGIIHLMEYGIVRNTVYQVSIESVLSLPHPFTDTDSPEDLKQDISIQIAPATWTQYHRGAVEIEY